MPIEVVLRRRLRSPRIAPFVAWAAAVGAVCAVSAQEEPTGVLTEEEHRGLEVIEVHADRTARDVQKVPASVSSFGASDLLDQGLTDFNTLQYNVPSLFSGGGLTKITLRGVGSEIVGPGVDPGFSVHVNSVFSSRETTGLLDYFDIERVDVLRGPQGTLWGRNSTGGAVNIVTNRAKHEFDAGGDVEYARYAGGADGVRLRGMLNLPVLQDELALRVAFLGNFNDGYLEVEGGGNDQRLSDAGVGTLRASLRWEPREDVTVDFIGSWFRSKGNGPGQKFDGDYFTPPPFPDSIPGVGTIAAWPGAGPGANFEDDPNFGPALANPGDPYKGTANEPQRAEATVYTATILLNWQAEHFGFDSITGYQSTDFFLHRDQDTSSLPLATLDLTDKSRQISQEFLIHSSWEESVDYIVGTNYQYDWTPVTDLEAPNAQNTLESANYVLYPALGGLLLPAFSLVDDCPPPATFPGGFAASCPPTKALGVQQEDFVHARASANSHIYGLFGNVTWRPIELWSISLGARFSYTRREWNDETFSSTYSVFTNGSPLAAAFGLGQPSGLQIVQRGVDQTDSWTAGTWKLSSDYQLTDDHLIWASVGTGERAGGFNFSEETSFGNESILAVEAGTKSMFFDDRLMFNLTGFWYDWDDPQIGATENSLPITRNAPSAEAYGVEFEFRALPTDELMLNGTFGWLEAEYDEDFVTTDSSLQDFTQTDVTMRSRQVNLKGARLPRSPQFTVSLGAQYTFDLGQRGLLIPRVDFYFRDRIQFRQYGNPADVAGSYTRTDIRLIWRSPTNQFWAEGFVRNLENEAVKTNQEIQSFIYRIHYYDAPINGGVRFGYNFQ